MKQINSQYWQKLQQTYPRLLHGLCQQKKILLNSYVAILIV